MKRIGYGETTIGTDDLVADLVLEYATLLARRNSADTVSIPGVVEGGGVEAVSLLIGPASQLTAWHDGEPFPGDGSAAVADIRRRIRVMSADIDGSDGDVPPGLDDFDELA